MLGSANFRVKHFSMNCLYPSTSICGVVAARELL